MHVIVLQEWRAAPPLACDLCGKMFMGRNRRQNLQQHWMIHTGVKPYSCPYCSHCSNRKGNLDMHIVRVHGDTVTRDVLNECLQMASPPNLTTK